MGEIADMMLEGLLDEETGEYIGEQNLERFGSEAPGFPVSYERENRHKSGFGTKKVKCEICGKRVKPLGLEMHKRDVHTDKANA